MQNERPKLLPEGDTDSHFHFRIRNVFNHCNEIMRNLFRKDMVIYERAIVVLTGELIFVTNPNWFPIRHDDQVYAHLGMDGVPIVPFTNGPLCIKVKIVRDFNIEPEKVTYETLDEMMDKMEKQAQVNGTKIYMD